MAARITRITPAYRPRPGAQMDAHRLIWSRRFSTLICHRRFGKTVCAVNDSIAKLLACPHPAPRVAYLCPFQNQARRVAWSYAQQYGRQYGELYLGADQQRMIIRMRGRGGEGELMLLGADNANSLRGLYLDDVKVDEAAQIAHSVWSDVLRPSLADRRGSATIMGTPAGRFNLLFDMWEQGADERVVDGRATWGRAMFKASETGYIQAGELEAMASEMTEESFAQELECSFDAGIKGAYYAKLIAAAFAEGRIGDVPYDPALPCVASWDLGMADATAVWICQPTPTQLRFIACLSYTGQSLPEILRSLPREYRWQAMIGPHDMRVRDYGVESAASRLQIAERLGYQFHVCADIPPQDGRDAVRAMLPRCVFDAKGCKSGLDALSLHHAKFDDDRQIESREAEHDWSSHPADSLRYFAVATNRGFEIPDLRMGTGQLDWSEKDARMMRQTTTQRGGRHG